MSRPASIVPQATRTVENCVRLPPLKEYDNRKAGRLRASLIVDENLPTISEYKNEYIKHSPQLTKALRPEEETSFNQDRLDDLTTHRVDYIKHEMTKTQPIRKMDKYVSPETKMENTTCYKTDFEKKKIDKRKPMKAKSELKISEPFKGTPVYRTEYVEWPLSKPKQPAKAEYVRPSISFEGTPTYKTDFIRYNEKPRRLLKPDQNSIRADEPLETRTGYRTDFVRHPIPEKAKRKREIWQSNGPAFEGITNYTTDFKEKEYSRRENFKPSVTSFEIDEPLENRTTQRDDYVKWEVTSHKTRPLPEYEPPTEPIDSRTTHSMDFTQKAYSKVESVKVVGEKKELEPFEDKTNYSQDYQNWKGEKAKPNPRKEYEPTAAKFEGIPTYTSDFVEHEFARRQLIKPASDDMHEDGSKFDENTIYRLDYTKKAIPKERILEEAKGSSVVWYEPISHRPFLSMTENETAEGLVCK